MKHYISAISGDCVVLAVAPANDVSRCAGTAERVCNGCLRKLPGYPTGQSYTDFKPVTGECDYKLRAVA